MKQQILNQSGSMLLSNFYTTWFMYLSVTFRSITDFSELSV